MTTSNTSGSVGAMAGGRTVRGEAGRRARMRFEITR
jgi:hypothetical protein